MTNSLREALENNEALDPGKRLEDGRWLQGVSADFVDAFTHWLKHTPEDVLRSVALRDFEAHAGDTPGDIEDWVTIAEQVLHSLAAILKES